MKTTLVACVLVIACGGKKDPTPAPTAGSAEVTGASVGTSVGKCAFTASGDVTLTVDAVATKNPPNGKAMATADYWQTNDQIRSALQTLSGLDSKKSKDLIAADVDAAMKKDPKFMLLLVNCGAENGSLNFGPGRDSKYADIPFKAGHYPITTSAVSAARAPSSDVVPT